MTLIETLRKEGYNKNIVMVTKEDVLPYDRKKLSKVRRITVMREEEGFKIFDHI